MHNKREVELKQAECQTALTDARLNVAKCNSG